MGDLYASAVGTTVLQVKEIPPRPAVSRHECRRPDRPPPSPCFRCARVQEYDGTLCIFGLKPGVDERALRKGLRKCQSLGALLIAELRGCDFDSNPPRVSDPPRSNE